MIKTLAVAAMVTAGAIGGAQASTLTSSALHFDVYNYDAGGSSANADATQANVAAAALAGKLVASFDYTGDVGFLEPSSGGINTIGAFLQSAGGNLFNFTTGSLAALSGMTMSTGGFRTTTLMNIMGSLMTGGTLSITHDDGISFCQSACSGKDVPTSAYTDVFNPSAGAFQLIYSAANGLPEQLTANMSAVPLPAAGFLLLGGLAGLAGLKRRKAA